jgi:hypothetical protein
MLAKLIYQPFKLRLQPLAFLGCIDELPLASHGFNLQHGIKSEGSKYSSIEHSVHHIKAVLKKCSPGLLRRISMKKTDFGISC